MNFFNLLSKNELDDAKPAVLFGKEKYDYKSLYKKIAASAKYLENKGVKKNDRVALLCDGRPEFIFTVFALWKLGAIPVPLNTKLLKNELEEQISFSECGFLIYGETRKKSAGEIEIKSIETGDVVKNDTSDPKKFSLEIIPENTALILFTSGSTGSAKAVELSFNNFIKSAETGDQIFLHNEKDIWLAALPFYHVGGFSIITRTFLYGAAIALPGGIGNQDLKESLREFNPTLSAFVTTQLKRLLDNNANPNPNLRHILLGGGFMDPELVKAALDNGWNVSKSFGTTETCSFVTALTKEEFKLKPDSAGKALHPNRILIVNGNREILQPNESGEVVVESESVAKGYLNNKAETVKRFSGNLFYTGDYGYLDAEGYLYIEARRSDLIVSGGENINPNEVERIIRKHPQVEDVFVYGSEDREWGHIIAAALVVKDNRKLTLGELKEFIKDKLPSYKHPKKIFLLESFPKTDLGKIQKEKLKNILSEKDQSR